MHCLGSLGELLHKPGSKYMLHKPQPKVYSGAKKNVSLAIIRWPVGGCRYRAQSTRDGLSETIYLSRFCDWGFKVSTGMYELKMNLSPLVYPLCKILRTLSSSQLGPLHVVKGFSNDFYDIWGPPTIFSLSLLTLFLSYRHRRERILPLGRRAGFRVTVATERSSVPPQARCPSFPLEDTVAIPPSVSPNCP